MLKNILNLKGVKTLSKEEQRNVNGGRCGDGCNPAEECCYRTQAGCFVRACPYSPPNCNCV